MARKTTIRNDSPHAAPASDDPQVVQAPSPAAIEDRRLDEQLRPSVLGDVVGQHAVVERLKILLDATRRRDEPLGHLLLDGPPGLGKTTLAAIIPRELGTDIQTTSGPSLSAPKDLLPYLTNASHRSVLFIDEIHRMPAAVEEFIYPAMEDFRVDITLGDGLNARTISMQLQPFTVIGATTRSGMLTAPLRDRFVNREHLDFYTDDELAVIVTRNAGKLRTAIEPEAAREIAIRSRGTPRKANNWLRWTRDYADARANGSITLEVARQALAMKGVDAVGLEETDRRFLDIIISVFNGGPAGVQAIAHTMNIPPDTLEDEIEPFLLREGFLQRTPRGRMVTARALQHLGRKVQRAPARRNSSVPSRGLFDEELVDSHSAQGRPMKAGSAPPTTIDEYISRFPEDVRTILCRIRKIIRDAAPEAEEAIRYQIPTSILHGNLVHFAAFAHHIGFYPTPSGIEQFREALAGYSSAKGSVQFPLDAPIPYRLITRIVKFRVSENRAKAGAKRPAKRSQPKPQSSKTRPVKPARGKRDA